MTMLSRTTLESIESLAGTIIENFTSSELISGCIISDVSELNLFGTGDGWVIALCGKHNNQRVRVLGGIALGVGGVIGVVHYPSTDIFIASFSGSQQPFEAGKSGIYAGGVITGAVAPNVDITAGSGQIVDSTTNLEIPTISKITWSAFLNEAPLNILTTDQTLLFIDSGGLLVKQNSATETDFRDKIFLGALVHLPPSAVIICDLPTVANNVGNYLVDLMNILRIRIVSGGIVTPVALSLTMQITSTEFFGRSLNFRVSQTEPNTLTSSAENPMIFAFSVIDGLISTGNTILDVANYNPTGSTISAIGGGANSGGLWRVYKLVNGADVILYPQFFYSNLSNILDNEDLDDISTVVPQFLVDFGILICKIATQKNVTDLSLTATTRFLYPSSFGPGGGGVSDWTSLSDTPSSFVGEAGKTPIVNSSETALEFEDSRVLIMQVENTSGATATVNDVGFIDDVGEYKTTTTEADDVAWCVVSIGGANNTDIYVARRGRVVVAFTGTTPAAGDFLITSTTAGDAKQQTTIRPEIFAICTAAGGGGTVECLLLTQRTMSSLQPAAIVLFDVRNSSDSDFRTTIDALPGGAIVRYDTPSSGNESCIVPTTTTGVWAAKMRLFNETQGTYALIDSVNTTGGAGFDGEITVTNSGDISGWGATDIITTRSQIVVTAQVQKFFDFEFTSTLDELAVGVFFLGAITDSGGVAFIAFHPFETINAAKEAFYLTQGSTLNFRFMNYIPIIENRFAARWNATGSTTLNIIQNKFLAQLVASP